MTLQLPSIIEFAEDKDYLALPFRSSPVLLYPLQKLALELLYGNSPSGISIKNRPSAKIPTQWQEAIERYAELTSIKPVSEFGLVWGRRSGKDFLLAITALYEAYRLLCLGDPHKHFNLSNGQPIVILVVGSSVGQVKIIQHEAVNMMQQSPIFRQMLQEGTVRIRDENIHFNQDAVRITFRTANSDSLYGLNVFSLIMSEPASFKHDSASRIRTMFKPVMNSFWTEASGKLIVASSPREEQGFLWEMYKTHVPGRLVLQSPTWEVNIKYTQESLRTAFGPISDEKFMAEFGGQFHKFAEGSTEQVTMRLRTGLIENLKQKAREIAYHEKRDVTYTDVIRDLLEREMR
jgi:hypothetical protein